MKAAGARAPSVAPAAHRLLSGWLLFALASTKKITAAGLAAEESTAASAPASVKAAGVHLQHQQTL